MNGELSGYLGHSQYGTKGLKVENASSVATGGSNNKVTIYTTNKTQSTTHNATGVYDMNGGAYEYVASYVNNGDGNLTTYGGDQDGDLCDNTGTKRGESTAYKTVYAKGTTDTKENNYNANAGKKGDAVWETSKGYNGSYSWFGASAVFPCTSNPFFIRGGNSGSSDAGLFFFNVGSGGGGDSGLYSFRPVLAF